VALAVREIAVNNDQEGGICDAEAARLLPWFVNGRLGAADAERVAQHLEHCAICRADLEEQRSVRAALKADGPVEYAPQAGLARTLARIDELTRDAAPAHGTGHAARALQPARRRYGVTQWLTAAVIVQAIGLGVLGSAYLARPAGDRADARYQTLSAPVPTASGPHIRAVFSASMKIGELKQLLAAQHLLIVAGPTDAGVFTLGVTDAAVDQERLEALLAGLRADPQVLFAEPATRDGAQSM
jgi:anti-sigma factor RsiW